MKELARYLSQFTEQRREESLETCFSTIRKLKKREFLIQPGQQFPYLAFIKRGLFRVYFINEAGIEVTTWFSFPGMMITDMMAYYKQSPTTFYIHALEDVEIMLAHRDDLHECFSKSTLAAQFGRLYAERALTVVMQRMLDFQTKSAEQRYRELLSKPEFMQRIPLKYLASYLGITDSSLSRIRAQKSS